MTSFTARFAGVAMLALAAVPLAAAPAAALASPMSIQLRDLDLNTDPGMARFHQRAEAVTKDMCRSATYTGYRVHNDIACRAAVKAEIADKLVKAQHAQAGRSEVYAVR